MSGVKGRSGPRKSPSKLVNEALAKLDINLPLIFESLIQNALKGDREAQIYLIDRRMGRPHQSIDQRIKGTFHLSADDYKLAIILPQLEQQRFIEQQLQIEGGTNGRSVTKGANSVTSEALQGSVTEESVTG